jgi:hypothetical protein
LRVETVANSDKKKSELYFKKSVKKFLTENSSGKALSSGKIMPGGIVDAASCVTHDLLLGRVEILFDVAKNMKGRTYLIRWGTH